MKDRTPDEVICNSEVFEIVKVTACKSVAVTVPTAVSPSSTVNVEEEVNTGATLSAIFTVLVAVHKLPDGSVAV